MMLGSDSRVHHKPNITGLLSRNGNAAEGFLARFYPHNVSPFQ
jgi:hypothetical protein